MEPVQEIESGSRARDIALGLVLVGAVIWGLFAYPTFDRVECLRTGPAELRWLTVVGDAGIATAYALIPIRLVLIWLRLRVRPEALLLFLFGAFILFCGATHALGIVMFWHPLYWIAAKLKLVTAAISLTVDHVLGRMKNELLKLGVQHEVVVSTSAELARKNADLEAAVRSRDEQLAVTEAQRRAIQGLTIPLLRIGNRAILIPLIGVLDSERASQVIGALLAEVAAGHADHTLVDLTGVEAVDTATAKCLLDMVAAAKLMGGRVMITGIQPVVSQTMVSLGVELGAEVHRTIEQGLAVLRERVGSGPYR